MSETKKLTVCLHDKVFAPSDHHIISKDAKAGENI